MMLSICGTHSLEVYFSFVFFIILSSSLFMLKPSILQPLFNIHKIPTNVLFWDGVQQFTRLIDLVGAFNS